MTQNSMSFWPQIVSIFGAGGALLIFAILLGMPHRVSVPPGSSGHREGGADEGEVIRPDGYIDSFAGVIEEAGGGMPPVVLVALPAILIWWLVYLILNWAPKPFFQ